MEQYHKCSPSPCRGLALHLFELYYFLDALSAFLVFCLASSAIYVINDIVDIEADKAHPIKKNRPLPSGQVTIQSAIIIAALLLILVFWLMMYFNKEFELGAEVELQIADVDLAYQTASFQLID